MRAFLPFAELYYAQQRPNIGLESHLARCFSTLLTLLSLLSGNACLVLVCSAGARSFAPRHVRAPQLP